MKIRLQGMLLELNLHVMAQVLDDQLSDPLFQELSKLEFVYRLVEEEYVAMNNIRTRRTYVFLGPLVRESPFSPRRSVVRLPQSSVHRSTPTTGVRNSPAIQSGMQLPAG